MFLKYGLDADYFPQDLKTLYDSYSYKHSKHLNLPHPIYNISWIFQWPFTVVNRHHFFILTCELYYKWWSKFEYSDINKKILKDIETFDENNLYVEHEEKAKKAFTLENQGFKAPSLASLKEKYPQASVQELKKKMLMALASQLDELKEDDIMSTSSKSQAPSNTQEKIDPIDPQDMDNYMA